MKEQTNKNSMFLRSLFLLSTMLLVFSGIRAQQPVQLTLKEALQYALKENQEARKSQLDIENSQYQIDEVRSRALPQVNASAGITYNPLLQKSALPNIFGPSPNPDETILVAFGQKWNSNATLSLNQTLFDQSVLTGLKAARTTKEFYRVNAALTEENIIEKVSTVYYQLLVQRQQVGVVDTTIRNTQKVQQVLQGQFENGLAKKIDLDRIKVNLSNLKTQRQKLINGVTLLENQLKFLIGMPINTPINVPEIDRNSIDVQAVALTDTINVNNRTELQLLRKQNELLNFQKLAYKSEYYPSLSLGGNYSYQGLGNKMPVFKGKSQGVNWFDVSSVSLNLKIPIFNGFATRSRVRQADISIRKLNEDIENTQLALNLAYENAKTEINNSIITLNTQRENVELAQEVYFNTQNNYNNGLASLTDLLNAETSLTEANNNLSSALLNYKVAEIQLIKSQGQLKSLLN